MNPGSGPWSAYSLPRRPTLLSAYRNMERATLRITALSLPTTTPNRCGRCFGIAAGTSDE